MKIYFTYDLEKEFDNLHRGTGLYNPEHQPKFIQEMIRAGIDLNSMDSVKVFIRQKIRNENIDIGKAEAFIEMNWEDIENEVTERLDDLFSTTDPFEDISGYLTFNTRCSYNFQERYFFVNFSQPNSHPAATTIHELFHFYTHFLIEPIFVNEKHKELFGEFKESLTVLMNHIFTDFIERKDMGYGAHTETRAWIEKNWKKGMTIQQLTAIYLK